MFKTIFKFNLIAAIFFLYICGCTTIKYVPIQVTDTVTVKEVVVDTVIQIQIQKEVVEVYTKDTLSNIETSFAKSVAQIEKGTLYHKLENKDSATVKIQYKDRIVERHSIKEVPIEVEKEIKVKIKVIPKWCWTALLYSIIITFFIILKIIYKIKY